MTKTELKQVLSNLDDLDMDILNKVVSGFGKDPGHLPRRTTARVLALEFHCSADLVRDRLISMKHIGLVSYGDDDWKYIAGPLTDFFQCYSEYAMRVKA